MSDEGTNRVFVFSEILEELLAKYKTDEFYGHMFGDIKHDYDMTAFNSESNNKYKICLPSDIDYKFRQFCIDILLHQGSRNIHPLTCGVDSNHSLLLPRIISHYDIFGSKTWSYTPVIFCPDCGYIQHMSFADK